MSELRVVQLPTGNLQDIPGMLRRIADRMESGEVRMPAQAVLVAVEDAPAGPSDIGLFVLGGECKVPELLGTLELAKAYVLGS